MGRDHHGQDLYGWDNEFGSEIKVMSNQNRGIAFNTSSRI